MALFNLDSLTSTYARLFIGLSVDISKLVVNTARQSPHKTTSVLGITILSQDQVHQSLADPDNQWLKNLIGTAYADNLKATRTLIKSQDNIDEQKIYIEQALDMLQEKMRTASTSLKADIGKAMDTLNQRYKLLNNIQNAATHGQKQIENLQSDFNDLVTTNRDSWITYRDKHLQQLRSEITDLLRNAGLSDLPQGEVDNLLRLDSWQEVLDRFNDVGASKDLPTAEIQKLLNLKVPDYSTYFRIKAYMAIRSVNPSRANMVELLKPLNKRFDQAQQEAKQLTTQQEASAQELDRKIQPTLELANSNYKTLEHMAADRDHILEGVVSRSDLEAIIERTQALRAEPRPSERNIPNI